MPAAICAAGLAVIEGGLLLAPVGVADGVVAEAVGVVELPPPPPPPHPAASIALAVNTKIAPDRFQAPVPHFFIFTTLVVGPRDGKAARA